MNASLKVLALLVALTTTVLQARADEEPPTVRKPFYAFCRPYGSSQFQVFINKNAPEPLNVTLFNRRGEVLYETEVGRRESGKALALNMSLQPDGVYTLVVRGKTETVKKTFVLSTPTTERMLAFRR